MEQVNANMLLAVKFRTSANLVQHPSGNRFNRSPVLRLICRNTGTLSRAVLSAALHQTVDDNTFSFS